MKMQNYTNLETRVNEITEILGGNWEQIANPHTLINERAEKEFILNKRGVEIRLTGDNKYYWAHQFAEFKKNIEKYGAMYHNRHIQGDKISFHKYSINEESSVYSSSLWGFDDTQEMKGFVKGYNAMCYILNDKEKDFN